MAKSKQASLVEQAKRLTRQKKPSWFDDMTPEQQAELLELKEEFLAKRIKVGAEQIYPLVVEKMGEIDCKQATFGKWMRTR